MAVENLSLDGLHDFTSKEKLTIIDFWAEWCGPCKALSPLIDSFANKYEGAAKFGKVNISSHPDAGAKFSIVSIPCVIVFLDGKEVDRMVGFKGKESLEELILKHTQGSRC